MGKLASEAYPNGVQAVYSYDSLDRLINLTVNKTVPLASYAYTLGPAGNRLSVTEQSGRTASYMYDSIYRLTGETVNGDPRTASNGSVSYAYDVVGNRLSRTSSIAGLPAQTLTYDSNDRLTSDAYDANGNTRTADGNTFTYNFENRIKSVNGGSITTVYDGDGKRAAKIVGGVTTKYLVDDLNPTGYSQVVEEIVNGSVERAYTYGNSLLGQNQLLSGNWTASFYGHDGHGSVRFLTDSAGGITDTDDYDAFGNLVASTGTTPNNYLYSGEQFDSDLGIYYLRARYYHQQRGRFMSSDPYPGHTCEPTTLHRYLYVSGDPINRRDPSGMLELAEYSGVASKISAEDVAEAAALSFAVTCLMYGVASILDPSIIPMIPPPFQFCARRAPRRCRCSIRMAPPEIMAECPHRVFGTGLTLGECQNNAKFTAPQQCRQYYGHCGWIP